MGSDSRVFSSPGPLVGVEEPQLAGKLEGRTPLGRRLARFLSSSYRPIAIYAASRAGVLLVFGAAAYATHTTFAHALLNWDSQWYMSIARVGYPHAVPPGSGNAAQSNLGFFPLLPLLIRAMAELTGASYAVAGLLVTSLFGLVGSVVVWQMLAETDGVARADRATAFVYLAPGAFVLSMVYTEAVVITLVAATLLLLRRRRWVLAGLIAGLATAADPLAVAVVVPCAWASFMAIWRKRDWRALWAPALSPWGVVAFFSFLWAWTGSPLAWFVAQRRGWQQGTFGTAIPQEIWNVATQGFSNVNDTVKLFSLVFAALMVLLFFRCRPDSTVAAYVLAVLAMAALSPVAGFSPRVILRAFPLFSVVGARLGKGWFEALLAVSALGMAAAAVLSIAPPPAIPFTP